MPTLWPQLLVSRAQRARSRRPHFVATGPAQPAPTQDLARLPPQIAKRVCLVSTTTTLQQPLRVYHVQQVVLRTTHSTAKKRALLVRMHRKARSIAPRAEQALLMRTAVQPQLVRHAPLGTLAPAHCTARGVLSVRTLSQNRPAVWPVPWAALLSMFHRTVLTAACARATPCL